MSILPVVWSLQDVEDELDAAIDALLVGDVMTGDRITLYHSRARRHLARARQLVALAQQETTPAATTEAVVPPPTLTPPTPVAPPVPQPVDIQLAETAIVTAIGGPYTQRSLIFPPNHVRWVVRDSGGVRTMSSRLQGRPQQTRFQSMCCGV